MAYLVTKEDFPAIVNFTTNADSRILDFHIKDGQEFDFQPRVSASFYTAIQVISSPLNEMDNLRINFVVPLLVCFAYQRFLLWAGRNITQYGIRTNNEDTSTEITDKARAELINEIKSKTNVYLTRFYNELKSKNYTFDSVRYNFDITGRTGANIKIRAVGGRDYPRCPDDYRHGY